PDCIATSHPIAKKWPTQPHPSSSPIRRRGRRAAAMTLWLMSRTHGVATVMALALLCDCHKEPAEPVRVTSDNDAAALVQRFFSAYSQGDVHGAVALLCEKDLASQTSAAEFISRSQSDDSPFRITRFSIEGVQP